MEQFSGIILLIIIGIIYYFVQENNKSKVIYIKETQKTAFQKAKVIIVKNQKQLSIQRKKSIFTDSYEKENYKNWYEKEIPYFIDNHILTTLNLDERNLILNSYHEIEKLIDEESKKYILKTFDYNSKMDGFEFEFFCSEKLKKEGWKVLQTKNTGDQGVDLIIEKGKRKIGVQCKKYSKPIGNKSVQEIKAGIEFYGLREGIVLGNTTYTKSAIELGNINNIKLIHFLETEKI